MHIINLDMIIVYTALPYTVFHVSVVLFPSQPDISMTKQKIFIYYRSNSGNPIIHPLLTRSGYIYIRTHAVTESRRWGSSDHQHPQTYKNRSNSTTKKL